MNLKKGETGYSKKKFSSETFMPISVPKFLSKFYTVTLLYAMVIGKLQINLNLEENLKKWGKVFYIAV